VEVGRTILKVERIVVMSTDSSDYLKDQATICSFPWDVIPLFWQDFNKFLLPEHMSLNGAERGSAIGGHYNSQIGRLMTFDRPYSGAK
jgi:hypothetical protein